MVNDCNHASKHFAQAIDKLRLLQKRFAPTQQQQENFCVSTFGLLLYQYLKLTKGKT